MKERVPMVMVYLGTCLAAPAFDVKTKPSLFIAFCLRIRRSRKQIPNQIKNAGIRRRVGTGRTSNRRLIDIDHFIQLLQTDNLIMPSRNTFGAV